MHHALSPEPPPESLFLGMRLSLYGLMLVLVTQRYAERAHPIATAGDWLLLFGGSGD
jgi:hypothetical protein